MSVHPCTVEALTIERSLYLPVIGLLLTAVMSLLFAVAASDRVYAGTSSVAHPTKAHQVEGRRHSGPKAYRLMCQRDPALCQADRLAARTAGAGQAADLTAERWQALRDVNLRVNNRLAPRDDLEVYGTSDFWTAGRFVGDCEDYMIAKKQDLIAAGWAADQVLYAVVEGIETPYHAVLIVRTQQGDFVLDNLTDRITRWDLSGYNFVIRQSAEQPDRWVRVVDQRTTPIGDQLATR
ncbi:MAG: transglutaminase-like cysteine peptidase [Pseudomonadota bacterium]